MSNTYESPESNSGNQDVVSTSLYKISGIGVATLFGTVLAGGILMYINFKRVGLEDKAKKCLLYTVVATVGLFGIFSLFPEDVNILNTAFIVSQVIAMIQISKNQQGTLIDEHESSGGAFSSNWKAFGVGLLPLVSILVISIGLAVFLP